MAEVVAQVLLQAQTDVLVEVAADPQTPPQNVDSAVAQVLPEQTGSLLPLLCSILPYPALPCPALSHHALPCSYLLAVE